jgi:uncharacterized repeat protein (TIGR02543 family)
MKNIGFAKRERDMRGRNVFAERLKSGLIGMVLAVAFALGCRVFGVEPLGGRRGASAEGAAVCGIGLSADGVEIAATVVGDAPPPGSGMTVAYELRLSGGFDVWGDAREQIVLKKAVPAGSASATLAPSFVVGAGSVGFSNSSYTGQELSFVTGETYTLELWSYAYADGLGGSWGKMADSSVEFARLYPLPPDPEPPAHHHFVGWYFDEGLTEAYDGRALYEDTDLYAKFEINRYTVSFVTNWSGSAKGDDVEDALTYYVPEDLTGLREDREFDGWYADAAFTALYDPAAPLTGDMTLYAKWTIKTVTVTFIVGGETYQVSEIPYGASLRYIAQTVANQLGAQTMTAYLDAGLTRPADPAAALTSDLAVYGVLSDGGGGGGGGGWWGDVKSWMSANKAYLIAGGACFAAALAIAAVAGKRKYPARRRG